MTTSHSADGVLSSFLSFFRKSPSPGQDEDHPLEVTAAPGLMTLLDVALYRSVEGELTATVASGHALLQAWLDVKHQAQTLLSAPTSSKVESFARACLEAALDAIEKLSTEPLASSGNLSDAHQESGVSSSVNQSAVSNIVHAIADSKNDSGRRLPLRQRPRDCWETARLLCPDHCWAEEAYLACQRHIRHLSKHPYCSSTQIFIDDDKTHAQQAQNAHTLRLVVQQDLPMRLYQFRTAIEADGVVSKRLYLVKCEYRAPFRAFLEAHQSVQRAPSLQVVDDFISLQSQPTALAEERVTQSEALQGLLERPELIQAISLEQECEAMEVRMAEALFPFTELARILDNKRARLKPVPRVLQPEEVGPLQETLRRLKYLLCRKLGPETSTGIRPLLLDLQGVPRDESLLTQQSSHKDSAALFLGRLQQLVRHLKLLGTICSTQKSCFVTDSNKRGDVELPSIVISSCRALDEELFTAQCQDWFSIVQLQHELAVHLNEEQIRRAEMQVSISRASASSLKAVRQRLEQMVNDRQLKLDVLKEMVEEVCCREMNLFVKLVAPEPHVVLELPFTSARGVFGLPLELAHERLPIG